MMTGTFGYATPGTDNLNGQYMPFFDPYAQDYANPQSGNLVGSAPNSNNPNPVIPYPTQGGTSNVNSATGNVDESAAATSTAAGPGSGALPITSALPAGQAVGGGAPTLGVGTQGAGSTASGAATSGTTGTNLASLIQAYLANPSDPATLAAMHTAVLAAQGNPPPGATSASPTAVSGTGATASGGASTDALTAAIAKQQAYIKTYEAIEAPSPAQKAALATDQATLAHLQAQVGTATAPVTAAATTAAPAQQAFGLPTGGAMAPTLSQQGVDQGTTADYAYSLTPTEQSALFGGASGVDLAAQARAFAAGAPATGTVAGGKYINQLYDRLRLLSNSYSGAYASPTQNNTAYAGSQTLGDAIKLTQQQIYNYVNAGQVGAASAGGVPTPYNQFIANEGVNTAGSAAVKSLIAGAAPAGAPMAGTGAQIGVYQPNAGTPAYAASIGYGSSPNVVSQATQAATGSDSAAAKTMQGYVNTYSAIPAAQRTAAQNTALATDQSTLLKDTGGTTTAPVITQAPTASVTQAPTGGGNIDPSLAATNAMRISMGLKAVTGF